MRTTFFGLLCKLMVLAFRGTATTQVVGTNKGVDIANQVVIAKQDLSSQHKESSIPESRKLTISEIITLEPSFSLFVALLQRFPSLLTTLDDLASTPTLFIPTNQALQQGIGDLLELPLLKLKDVLDYHIVLYPLSYTDLFCTPTLPTLLNPKTLNGPQRMRLVWTLEGQYIDSQARVLPQGIQAANGYIHPITALLRPPTHDLWDTIFTLPSDEFGLFQSVLRLSGLVERLRNRRQSGWTVFVPTNAAIFKPVNASNDDQVLVETVMDQDAFMRSFIFSEQTLFSNAFYGTCEATQSLLEDTDEDDSKHNVARKGSAAGLLHLCRFGRRLFHLAALSGDSQFVRVFRAARMIEMTLDEKYGVSFARRDLTANNGVIHVIDLLSPG